MFWKIDYWGKQGKAQMHVLAPDRRQAMQLCGIPTSCIIAARLDLFCFRVLFKKKRVLSYKAQLVALLNIQANCLTGNFDQAVKFLERNRSSSELLEVAAMARREDLNLSQRLKTLGFDHSVVNVIASGERAGQLNLGVAAAIQYLKQMVRIKQQTLRPIFMSAVLFGIVCVAFFVVPPLTHQSLQPFLQMEEIGFDATLATYILLWLGGAHHAGWWLGVLLLVVVGGVAVGYHKLHFYPFSVIHAIARSQRSARFLATWSLYRIAGLALEHDSDTLTSTVGLPVAQEMLVRLSQGEALVQTVTTRHFIEMLVQALPALNQYDSDHLKQTTALLLDNFQEDMLQKQKQLSNLCYLAAAALGFLLICLLAYGLMFPLLGSFSGLHL